jgi:hypothetical protein
MCFIDVVSRKLKLNITYKPSILLIVHIIRKSMANASSIPSAMIMYLLHMVVPQ